MYRLSYAIVGNEADATEVAQDALVALWRQLPRLREPERFDAWLQRIVVNAARQLLRTDRRRRAREITSSSVLSLDGRPAPTVRDDAGVLGDAMATLPVEQRAILVLHHLEGHGLAELADILAIPVGTAKSRLFTARRALAARLERESGR